MSDVGTKLFVEDICGKIQIKRIVRKLTKNKRMMNCMANKQTHKKNIAEKENENNGMFFWITDF